MCSQRMWPASDLFIIVVIFSADILARMPSENKKRVTWCSLPGWGKFLLSQLPPRDVGPALIPYLLVPFVLLDYMRIFLTALVEWDLLEVFSGYSVRTVPHVDVFFTSPRHLLCHLDILLETINFWEKLFNFLKNSWDQ